MIATLKRNEILNTLQVFEMPRSRYAMVEDGPPYSPWYVGWANCDRKAAKVLRNYYERPTFLPEDSRDRKHI